MTQKLSERLLKAYHEAVGWEAQVMMGLLEQTIELVQAAEAWARAMRGPTSVPPVVDRSIEEAEQALLKLLPEAD